MITNEELEYFNQTRAKLFSAIRKELEVDNGHKSSEGAMSIEIAWPNYFEALDAETKPRMGLHVYCYVLGPHRHYDYFGKSLTECLNKFNKDLDSWVVEVKS